MFMMTIYNKKKPKKMTVSALVCLLFLVKNEEIMEEEAPSGQIVKNDF